MLILPNKYPKINDKVYVNYAKPAKYILPLQNKIGTIKILWRPKCRPCNVGVLIDGRMYVIPQGNLNYIIENKNTLFENSKF